MRSAGPRRRASRSFGDSLRDQLRRRIAQLDDQATGELRLTLVGAVAAAICGMAIYVASRRINDVAYNEDWPDSARPDFLVRLLFGAQAAAPLGATGHSAPQAPAGGVAEGARCSVDSRLELHEESATPE